jgi:hypothetical protein
MPPLRLLPPLAACLLLCAAAGAGAREAAAPKPHGGAKTHRAAKAQASDAPPCPRGSWKDDPVCFDAPDAGTLPTPSTQGREAKPLAGAGFQPAEAENLSLGVTWGANNNSTSRETTPLRSVGAARKTADDKDDWGGGGGTTHLGAGVNLKF